MAGLIEIRVPDLGDYKDVEVIDVPVKVGDVVAREASLITLETEKATMDVPSTAAGTIRELKIKRGDRVYIANDNQSPAGGAGTYAEEVVCPPTMLHHLPPRVSYSQGAALGVPYATAYRALFMRANARPAETVFVHGATGGVGIAAVQLAKAFGLRVIGSGGTEAGLDVVRKQGADVVVNHREPEYLKAVMDATGGRGVDVVLEMAAHINLDKVLQSLIA